MGLLYLKVHRNLSFWERRKDTAGSNEGGKHGQKKQVSQGHGMVVGVTVLQFLIITQKHRITYLAVLSGSHMAVGRNTWDQIAIVSCLDHKIFLPLCNLISQGHTFAFLSRVYVIVVRCLYWGLFHITQYWGGQRTC